MDEPFEEASKVPGTTGAVPVPCTTRLRGTFGDAVLSGRHVMHGNN